jgi:hypothetical protein
MLNSILTRAAIINTVGIHAALNRQSQNELIYSRFDGKYFLINLKRVLC